MLRFQLPCVRPFDYRNKCFVSSESLYRKHPNIEKIIPMVNPVDLNIPPDYIVLGIESSCDDTSVCLLQKSHQTLIPTILYEKTIHQTNIHKYYGGVVPYLASKEHRHHLPLLLKEIIDIFGRSQGRTFPGFDFVAATRGPGLPASLSAGWHSAKTLSAALNIPLMGVHHMEGHALMAQFENSDLLFPFYALLLSGGHTLLLEMESLGKYHIIGQSLDDNIGESLDI